LNCSGLGGHLVIEQGLKVTTQLIVCEAETVNRAVQSSQDVGSRLHLKCYGTRAETKFRLSAKRTSPFKSAGASVQSTTGSRGVHMSGSNAGYTMFRGSVKGTGYPLPSLPLPASPCAITLQLDFTSFLTVGQRKGFLPIGVIYSYFKINDALGFSTFSQLVKKVPYFYSS